MRDWWKLNKDIHFLHYLPESDAYTQCGSTSRRLKFKIFVPLTKQLIESLIRLTPEIKNNKRGKYIYIEREREMGSSYTWCNSLELHLF